MAILIPTLNSCLCRMTSGERRFAQRVETKLENDYLVWYDVPVGSSGFHPDFIILHPRRGLLILEIKDWKLEHIQRLDKTQTTILTNSGAKQVLNPFEQARIYAHAVANLLSQDSALIAASHHPHQGKLLFPWSYGVVLSRITRRQFGSTNLGEVLPPHRIICQDEMVEDVNAEKFQSHLWNMFPWQFGKVLSLPQIDRVRWHLFPEIRIFGKQQDLFTDDLAPTVPDIMRIMDFQQELLARSLGEGHRVIHGVAGSGKTMILGYRCVHLARTLSRPILVLCYNVALASFLESLIARKGLAEKVSVRNFHAWCREQLVVYHVPLPGNGQRYAEQLVEKLMMAVDSGQIPAGQYGAVLIDEGHDFLPEWLRLVAQMVDPDTNSLLVLYDDAQSIYSTRRNPKFSFKSVGIQAQGRTTVLRLNYRNTAEVLRVAYDFAREVLAPLDADEDGIPLISPETAERHGPLPELMQLPSFSQEADYITERFIQLNAEGMAWRDMAVVYRSNFMGEKLAKRLSDKGIPVEWLQQSNSSRRFRPDDDSVKVVTFHSSKGLEFPVVAIPGLGYMPYEDQDPREEVRLMYVGMTRAMERLIITCHRESAFVSRLNAVTSRIAA
ncbi:MAG: 3'-5' exonuclease [Methylococcaceae bacterium]|nr:3'-5' exonuclease [Methylococcaceae bacterium]